jgi:site-specific DNA recombinase
MRAVIYARFSTDLQDERSIADQVALCKEYAQRQGHDVIAVYEDASASGASLHGRPAIMRLLAEAARGCFDLVLAESMSRVGRDQEDRAAIRKRLGFHSIAIATPTDGVVTPLVDGIRAVIDSQQLEDLKHHTRRGMRSRVHEGRSAGGRAYGYDVLPPEPDGHGNFKRGARRINHAEAAIMRRIFQDYVAGSTPRDIAKALNAERVPPPRGRSWNASTINGNRKRGNGLLLNHLYAGKLVWNKVTMPKDPATGKRVIRPSFRKICLRRHSNGKPHAP